MYYLYVYIKIFLKNCTCVVLHTNSIPLQDLMNKPKSRLDPNMQFKQPNLTNPSVHLFTPKPISQLIITIDNAQPNCEMCECNISAFHVIRWVGQKYIFNCYFTSRSFPAQQSRVRTHSFVVFVSIDALFTLMVAQANCI